MHFFFSILISLLNVFLKMSSSILKMFSFLFQNNVSHPNLLPRLVGRLWPPLPSSGPAFRPSPDPGPPLGPGLTLVHQPPLLPSLEKSPGTRWRPCQHQGRQGQIPGHHRRSAVRSGGDQRKNRWQLHRRRGQARREEGRARLRFSPIHSQIRSARRSRRQQHHLQLVLRWRPHGLGPQVGLDRTRWKEHTHPENRSAGRQKRLNQKFKNCFFFLISDGC